MFPATKFNPTTQPPLVCQCPRCHAPLEIEAATIELDIQAAGEVRGEVHTDLLECPECGGQFSYTARPVVVWAVEVEALAPAPAQNIPFSFRERAT